MPPRTPGQNGPRYADDPDPHLPPQFVDRMRQLLGDEEAAELLHTLAQPPDVGLRLNGLRGDVRRLLERLPWDLTPVPWCSTAFVVQDPSPPGEHVNGRAAHEQPSSIPPGRHPYQLAGAYYLQDPAATAVAEALAPRPGELVLDLAAAPGGKSTHLAALLGGSGWLVANDVHPQRAQALVGNLERCGVTNATVTNETPARLAQAWPSLFDRVLLDAPCSGEGMFRKSADAREMWSLANVMHCAARQDDLLLEAARLVKPGGYLAYSTCTLAPEENEGSVARFLAASGFELVPLALPGTSPGRADWSGAAPLPQLTGTVRIWPHLAPGEGHFVALLRRPEDSPQVNAQEGDSRSTRRKRAELPAPGRAVQEAWREFAAGALTGEAARQLAPTALQGDWLLHLPAGVLPAGGEPDLQGLRWLRHGLQLAQVRQGARSTRVEPAHALAMALPAGATARRLELEPDDERLALYLQGADVPAAGEAGYLRVEVQGLPLGWGKRSGGVVRSLLPKGLRRPA